LRGKVLTVPPPGTRQSSRLRGCVAADRYQPYRDAEGLQALQHRGGPEPCLRQHPGVQIAAGGSVQHSCPDSDCQSPSKVTNGHQRPHAWDMGSHSSTCQPPLTTRRHSSPVPPSNVQAADDQGGRWDGRPPGRGGLTGQGDEAALQLAQQLRASLPPGSPVKGTLGALMQQIQVGKAVPTYG
jgi:hypothetical protein